MSDIFCVKNSNRSAKLALLLLAFLTLVAIGCNQDRAIAVEHLNKGIKSFQSGQTMAAIKELKLARDQDPTYADPALYLGDIYHQEMDEFALAEKSYREALKRDPENIDTSYKLGAVLYDQKKYSEAATLFKTVVAKDPAYAKAWFRLGLSQQAQAKYADAVDSYMKSIRANPRMKMSKEDRGGAAYHALGDLYARFGFYDKSLAVYENGILNNKSAAQLYAGRGVAEQKLKRPSDAEDSFEKALELDPTNVAATFNLAVVKNALGQKADAMKVLESYLSSANDPARRQAAQGLLQKLRTSETRTAEAVQ
jgi:tetratricopeptide (TPR) repeat protein